MAAGLSCEPEPLTGVVLRDMEVDVHGRSASVILRSASSSVFWSDQSKFSGKSRSSGAL